jgi:hypothetical protein
MPTLRSSVPIFFSAGLQAGYEADELLVRVDSAHDSSDFIEALSELGVKYLVKRNPRKESLEQLLDSIRCDETP